MARAVKPNVSSGWLPRKPDFNHCCGKVSIVGKDIDKGEIMVFSIIVLII